MRLFLGTDYDETTCLNGFKIQKSRFKGFKSDEIRMAYVRELLLSQLQRHLHNKV